MFAFIFLQKKMPTVQLAQSLDENSLTMGEGMLR